MQTFLKPSARTFQRSYNEEITVAFSAIDCTLNGDKGVYASNGTLVQRAVEIVRLMGARTLTPAEAREKIGLKKRG